MEPVTYRIEEVTNPERTATMERVLLTAEEVGEALHIGRTRVYELLAAGEITSVKIGHLRRIPVDAVRDYAARLVAEVMV
jgi:excisionase family DNA binding protein